MNTNWYRNAAAVVTGARHLRAGRNGQDAVATIVDGDAAVAVVCDGCSAGSSSEVGARLGARQFARAVMNQLAAGASVTDPAMWAAARLELAAMLQLLATTAPAPREIAPIVRVAAIDAGGLAIAPALAASAPAVAAIAGGAGSAPAVAAIAGGAGSAPAVGVCGTGAASTRGLGGAGSAPAVSAVAGIGHTIADPIHADSPAAAIDRAALRDLFLFTIVAAAMTRDGAAVWALGDGAYVIDGEPHALGPFANNEPPYLGYDLVGDVRPAHLDVRGPEVRTIVVATDGALELAEAGLELGAFAAPQLLAHPDALRRQLVVLARGDDRIDWDAQRVVRTPAVLQDDCGIAILQRAWELA